MNARVWRRGRWGLAIIGLMAVMSGVVLLGGGADSANAQLPCTDIVACTPTATATTTATPTPTPTVTPTPPPTGVLSVVKTCPDNVGDAVAFTCTIAVRNTSADAVTVEQGDTLIQDDLILVQGIIVTNFAITSPFYLCTTTLIPPATYVNGTSGPVQAGPGGGGIRARCDWNVAPPNVLSPNAVVTFTANITIDNTSTGPLTVNNSAVTNPDGDISGVPVAGSRSARSIIVAGGTSGAVLSLTKSCPDSVVEAVPFICIIVIENGGPGAVQIDAGDVVLEDSFEFPAGVTMTLFAVTDGGASSCTSTVIGGTGTLPGPIAGPGVIRARCLQNASTTFVQGGTRVYSAFFTLDNTSPAPVVTGIINRATGNPDGAFGNAANRPFDAETIVLGAALPDLTIAKTCPPTVANGTSLTCTILVSNLGTAAVFLDEVTVLQDTFSREPGANVAAFPATITKTSGGVGLITCRVLGSTIDAETIACIAEGSGFTIPAGETVTFTFSTPAARLGTTGSQTLTNLAVVDPNNVINEGPGEQNNSATATTTVVPAASPASLSGFGLPGSSAPAPTGPATPSGRP